MAASASPHTPAGRASKARPPSRSGIALAAIAASVAAVAVAIFGSCVDPNAQSQGAQAPQPVADQPIVLDEGSAPAAAPAPTPAPAAPPAAAPTASPAQAVAMHAPEGKGGNNPY